MNIRESALRLLREADRDNKYISLALDAFLTSAEADERDKALLANLVYGVTERRVTLDYYISELCGKPCESINIRVLFILRLGLYQLMYLDRIPPHAAVNETVRLGKSGGERAFINGVLRGYIRRGKEIELPKDESERLSVKYSFPVGIVEQFRKNLGGNAENALEALSKQPPTTICVNTLRMSVTDALNRLQNSGISASICEISPRGIVIEQNITYRALCDILGEDGFFVQDEASQIAVTLLSPKENQIGADVCACPGSKSFHAALLMQNSGKIHSFDIHESKLPLISDSAKRLGIDIIVSEARDARNPSENLIEKCDFVICDVPCSGLGVLAKKPDIRFHSPGLPEELAPLGYEILCASSSYLKKGGRLLFSTCTLTKAENENNFAKFLCEHKEFAAVDFETGDLQSENGCATLIPNGRRDGFFIALATRIAD